MLEDCIIKLQELDRNCRQVNEMTPDMHKEYESALIELLQHAVIENQKAAATIAKMHHELQRTRWSLKTLMTRLNT